MSEVQDLLKAAERFVGDALAARDTFLRSGRSINSRLSHLEFAGDLASLPSARETDAAAADAANANAYLISRDGSDVRPPGRRLSSEALQETGISALLLAGEEVSVSTLAAELTSYLAGPPVPIWNYTIIDADVILTAPMSVVDGWELVTPTAPELAALAGLPSAARYLGQRSFNLDLYGGLAMLRRIDPEGGPRRDGDLVFHWNLRPAHSLWQPLLALSLFENPVVHLWAQYDVEPGRRVEVRFDRVDIEPWFLDGETEIEVVRHGQYKVNAASEPGLRRFLEQLAPVLDGATAQPAQPTKKIKERAAQLRRVAEHFLTAGESAYGEGEVLSEFNADAVLHYVIALEAVLAGGDSDKTDLARKVTQRAAVLAGQNDRDRRGIAEVVQAAYRARSTYAHGGEPRDIDLPALRRVVRHCILARLILGDLPTGGSTLAEIADVSLVDHGLLADQVRRPIDEFWGAVGAL